MIHMLRLTTPYLTTLFKKMSFHEKENQILSLSYNLKLDKKKWVENNRETK